MPKRGANIYKRKDGRWEARYVKEILPDGKKKYGSVYAKTYFEAKEKQHYYISKKDNKTVKCNLTISELSNIWLQSIEKSVKILTFQKYAGIVKNHIVPILGIFFTKQICGQKINEFANKKLERLSPGTVNEILIVLGEIFSFAEKEYGITKPQYKMIREYKNEMRVLTKDEQQRLECFLYDDIDIYKFGVLLALYTGVRIGELCALNWKDIDTGVLTINKTMHRISTPNGSKIIIEKPKTDSSIRKIPVPDFLAAIIAKYGSKGSVLKTKNGAPVEPRLLQQKFSNYLCACKIEGATFHTLRHTFATRCVEAGFEIKSLSEILGHASVKITLDKYVHSSLEQKRKNMNLLKTTSNF